MGHELYRVSLQGSGKSVSYVKRFASADPQLVLTNNPDEALQRKGQYGKDLFQKVRDHLLGLEYRQSHGMEAMDANNPALILEKIDGSPVSTVILVKVDPDEQDRTT